MTDQDDSEILVGRWDCPYGHPGQDGEAMKCAGCGAPRPKNVEFYLPSDARVVTDDAGRAAAKAGSDLICESCGSSVAAGQTICPQCSAPLDENKRQQVSEYASRKEVPGESPLIRRRREEETPLSPSAPRQDVNTENRGRRSGYRFSLTQKVLGIATAILAVLGIWWLVTPHPIKLTVQSVSWTRTIAVEEQRTVHEEDWTVPTGGRETGTYQAVHHHDSRKIGERQVRCHLQGDREKVGVRHFTCHPGGHREQTGTRHFTCHPGGHREQTGTRRYPCGTTNLGNGRFSQRYCSEPTYSNRSCSHSCSEPTYTTRSCTHDCQEDKFDYVTCKHSCIEDIMEPFPVYATKHRYDIERWFDHRTEQAGAHDTVLRWPPLNLSPQQREKARNETRSAIFADIKGRTFTVNDPPADYWSRLKTGMKCTATLKPDGTFIENPVCN